MTGEIYQFVLAAVYHADGLWGEATFDLFPRAGGRAGDQAGQWVVAGVEVVWVRLLPRSVVGVALVAVMRHEAEVGLPTVSRRRTG